MAIKAVCGIDIDRDMTFLSFACMRKGNVSLLAVDVFNKGLGDDLPKFFQDNIADLRRLIDNVAAKQKFSIGKIFVKLPVGLERMSVAEEVVALKRTKKIVHQDLFFIKKYLENNAIDWDDHCIHHFPLNFGVEGKAFESLPVGFSTKRLRMKSLLVTVKDKLRLQVQDIFDTYDMRFGGFVSTGVSDFSATFFQSVGVKAVINIGYDSTLLTVVRGNVLQAVECFNFGLNNVIEALSGEFSLPNVLAREVFDRYISLRPCAPTVPADNKEINLMDSGDYINLSVQKVNAVARDCLRGNIDQILARLVYDGNDVQVAFLGRLSDKDGFEDFLHSFIPYQLQPRSTFDAAASAFGCARYGMSKFLENIIQPTPSLRERLATLYREYF
jgi:hypothetical protein